MNSVRHDLVLMVQLQTTYDRIAEAIHARGAAPAEVQQLHQQNRQREQELEQLQARIGELTEQLRESKKREEEFKLELEHFQKQKSVVTNEREFTAVISEIDYATKGLQESTAKRQETEAAVAEIEAEIAERKAARPEEEAAHKAVVADWESRKKEVDATIHKLNLGAKRIEKKLNPINYSRFSRLLTSKHGTALATLVDGTCSACHFSVRPHLQQRIRKCEELIFCEHCRRILYSEDSLAAAVEDAG